MSKSIGKIEDDLYAARTALRQVPGQIKDLQKTVAALQRAASQPFTVSLPVFANNAAAAAAGLAPGATYRTGADPDFICVVH